VSYPGIVSSDTIKEQGDLLKVPFARSEIMEGILLEDISFLRIFHERL